MITREPSRPSFIVEFWARIFEWLRVISIFGLVRLLSKRLEKQDRLRQTLESHWFVDLWSLTHLGLAMAAGMIAAVMPGSTATAVLAAYGLLRSFEIVVTQMNVLLFDPYRARRTGYAIHGPERMVVLLLQNFAEIVLWFAVTYAAYIADVRAADLTWLGLLRESFVATVSFGSSAPPYASDVGLIVLFWQGLVGLFMTLLSLARFIGMLPPVDVLRD